MQTVVTNDTAVSSISVHLKVDGGTYLPAEIIASELQGSRADDLVRS
jgi:hypothetical protein